MLHYCARTNRAAPDIPTNISTTDIALLRHGKPYSPRTVVTIPRRRLIRGVTILYMHLDTILTSLFELNPSLQPLNSLVENIRINGHIIRFDWKIKQSILKTSCFYSSKSRLHVNNLDGNLTLIYSVSDLDPHCFSNNTM